MGEKSPQKDNKSNSQQPRSNNKGFTYEVVLLDGEHININLDKNAEGQLLFDEVCKHLDLLEKEYFGLQFTDERLPANLKCWLMPEKKIAKQKKRGPWVFDFALKFYPPDPTALKESLTRWLVVQQTRRDILANKLPTTFLTQAMLGSYCVQADIGDFDPSEHHGIEYIKDMPFSPTQTSELLEKITELHRQHKGQTPDEADINFLENAKKLAMYGVDRHDAKDADNEDINVGVCASGLQVYKDKLRMSRYVWPKIVKISYKRKQFYVKVRSDKNPRESNNVIFKLDSHRLAKRLWKISVEHHGFFRLRETEQANNSAMFPRLGSKFRYSGRTLYQARHSSQILDRPDPYFERSQPSRESYAVPNKSKSVDELTNRPDYWKDSEQDVKRRPSDDNRHDRKPGDEYATLTKEKPQDGDAMALSPAEMQKKAKEDEKERKKREKEEEKRRKKEEQERKKADKKHKGKHGLDPTAEDRRDQLEGGDNTERAPGRLPGSYGDQEGDRLMLPPFISADKDGDKDRWDRDVDGNWYVKGPDGRKYRLGEDGRMYALGPDKKGYPVGEEQTGYSQGPIGLPYRLTDNGQMNAKGSDGKEYPLDEDKYGYVRGPDGNDYRLGQDGCWYTPGSDGKEYPVGDDGSRYVEGPDGKKYRLGKDGRWYTLGPDGKEYPVQEDSNRYVTGPDGKNYKLGNDGIMRVLGPDGKAYPLGEDGTRYAKGPDGREYRLGDDGRWNVVGPNGVECPLGEVGNRYVTGPDGKEYRMGEDGQMYVKGPDGKETPVGEKGNWYKRGPDNKDYRLGDDGRMYALGPHGKGYPVGEEDNGYARGPNDTPYRLGEDGRMYIPGPGGKEYPLEEDGAGYVRGPDGRDYRLGQDGCWYTPSQDGKDQVVGDDGSRYVQAPDGKKYRLGKDGRWYTLGPDGKEYPVQEDLDRFVTGPDGKDYQLKDDGYWYGQAPEGKPFRLGQDGGRYVIGPDGKAYPVDKDGRRLDGQGLLSPEGKDKRGKDKKNKDRKDSDKDEHEDGKKKGLFGKFRRSKREDDPIEAEKGAGYGAGYVPGMGVGAGDMTGVVGKESWIDNKLGFEPIVPPVQHHKDALKGRDALDPTMPFFSPAATSTVNRHGKIPPPVPPKSNSSFDDSFSKTDVYKTERDGIEETRVQHKVVLSSTDDDFDYDAALAEAIRSVTEFNPDMSVERIECVQQIEEVKDK